MTSYAHNLDYYNHVCRKKQEELIDFLKISCREEMAVDFVPAR